jgi:hypothetical protein
MWLRGASDQLLSRRQRHLLFGLRCNPAWISDSLREADAAFFTAREHFAEIDGGWQASGAAQPAIELCGHMSARLGC